MLSYQNKKKAKQSDITLVTYIYCNTMHGTMNLKLNFILRFRDDFIHLDQWFSGCALHPLQGPYQVSKKPQENDEKLTCHSKFR
jgi:hypothetical protein